MSSDRSAFAGSASSGFRLWRNILRRWPNAAAVTRSRHALSAGASGAARGRSETTAEATFGGGVKAAAGRPNNGTASHNHWVRTGKPAIGFRRRPGGQPVGDFALEHQDHAFHVRQIVQPADQQGRADIVGQVADDPVGRRQAVFPRRRLRVCFQRIGFDRDQPAFGAGGEFGERGERPAVDLYRQNPCAFAQQRAGQAARTGADLDHGSARQVGLAGIAGGPGNPAGQVGVEQEMLAQVPAGREAVPADDIAQRRQVGKGRRFRHVAQPLAGTGAGARRCAMAAAICSAAIRLDGLARPVPAMSSAVP